MRTFQQVAHEIVTAEQSDACGERDIADILKRWLQEVLLELGISLGVE